MKQDAIVLRPTDRRQFCNLAPLYKGFHYFFNLPSIRFIIVALIILPTADALLQHHAQPYSVRRDHLPGKSWAITRRRGTKSFSSTSNDSLISSTVSSSTSSHCVIDPAAIYIHIPYCRRRCRYCDFAIVPIGTRSQDREDEDRQGKGFYQMDQSYKQAILAELDLLFKSINDDCVYGDIDSEELDLITHPSSKKIPLQSIYFGGGTPSLAPTSTLQEILHRILYSKQSPFCIPSVSDSSPLPPVEITIEMDPGTFTIDKLQAIKDMGFNRISLGVQSFSDSILEAIGRTHRCDDVLDSIDMIQQVYGNENDVNYSIDLISGLPGVTAADWIETLQYATSLKPQPTHMSLYDLQIESGTVFGKLYEDSIIDDDDQRGLKDSERSTNVPPVSKDMHSNQLGSTLQLPSTDTCSFCYKFASGYLKSKGYEHYEISSYAKSTTLDECTATAKAGSALRSRHNQIYWEVNGEWYAVGLGATSCVKGKRFSRPRTMSDYISWVTEEEESSKKNITPSWISTSESTPNRELQIDRITDTIMTRLRTSDGLDMKWITEIDEEYGYGLYDKIIAGASLGLELDLMHWNETKDILTLKTPDGFLFSNSIISSIFAEIL